MASSRQMDAVVRWLRLFVRAGQLTELRALHVGGQGKTVCGWFDSGCLETMAGQAVELSETAAGVYFVPNPITPQAPIKGRERLGLGKVGKVGKGECTEDADILHRYWLLIDADPVRAAGTTATEGQRSAAWEVIDGCRSYLGTLGYSPGAIGDSGNGWHLSLPVDLANDDAGREQCRKLLLKLNRRFGNARVKIDTSTYNAARIWRLYGTLNRKGKGA